MANTLERIAKKLRKLGLKVVVKETNEYDPIFDMIVKESLSYNTTIRGVKHHGFLFKGKDSFSDKRKIVYQISQYDKKGHMKGGQRGKTIKDFVNLTTRMITLKKTLKQMQYIRDKEEVLEMIYKAGDLHDLKIFFKFKNNARKILDDLTEEGLIKKKTSELMFNPMGLPKSKEFPFLDNIVEYTLTTKGYNLKKLEKQS